jgi:hypothetical protein
MQVAYLREDLLLVRVSFASALEFQHIITIVRLNAGYIVLLLLSHFK